MSATSAQPATDVHNLMQLFDHDDIDTVCRAIALVDTAMIGMLVHRPHDRSDCAVWSDEKYHYLSVTRDVLGSLRDSFYRFAAVGQANIPAISEALT